MKNMPDMSQSSQSHGVALKVSLKRALATNLSRLFKLRDLRVKDVAALLVDRGADINQYAVRAWLRQSEARPTLPSVQNLVYLSDLLGVPVGDLLGRDSLAEPRAAAFYQKLREGENSFERDLLDCMERLGAEYETAARDDYLQEPLAFPMHRADEADHDAEKYREIDEKAGYYLLSNNLVRLDPDAVARDTFLEDALKRAWEKGNGSLIDCACVYKLPGRISGSPVVMNGIAESVFLRCAAQYLVDNVFRSGCTIGIAGGRSMAGLMKMLPRSNALSGCNFFPLLRPGSLFADSAVGSTAIISDLLFRFGDMGLRMPDDIDLKDTVDGLINVADVLLFTLGTVNRSSVSRLLHRIRNAVSTEEQERLGNVLAGDILFHFFTKSGHLVEDLAEGRIENAPENEKRLAFEFAGTGGGRGEDARRHLQTREAYWEHVRDVRPSLEQIRNHAKKPNRRTILTVAGIDKLDILKTFREKVCETRMHITVITEQSLAREFLRSRSGL